ncbi:thioredoxin superfamily protein [Wolffia australiana]
MADYHYVYKDVEGASTEWDDIQRRLGNLPPKPEPLKPSAYSPAPIDVDKPTKTASWIDEKTEEELEDLEDDRDLDDDRFLEEYRKKRLGEIREAARISKFGSVVQITGSDFVREVSKASPDLWVVVLLYKDGMAECSMLLRCLDQLAQRYPATKFVKIISKDCIPNYPDCNLPTILIYNSGAVKGTLVGLHPYGGGKCSPEAVALAFCQSDPVLNDGRTSGESSRKAVIDGVRRKFIESIVKQRENDEDDSSD